MPANSRWDLIRGLRINLSNNLLTYINSLLTSTFRALGYQIHLCVCVCVCIYIYIYIYVYVYGATDLNNYIIFLFKQDRKLAYLHHNFEGFSDFCLLDNC